MERGPDANSSVELQIDDCMVRLTLMASVLHIRGKSVTPQPLCDEQGNILLWNGEIFGGEILVREGSNDGREILDRCTHILIILSVVAQ